MPPSPPGEPQIDTAVDLVQTTFSRRHGAHDAPDLRLMLGLSGQTVQLNIHGAGLAAHLGGVFNHLMVQQTPDRIALHIELAELVEPDIAALSVLAVPAPGLVATPPDGNIMVELHHGLAIAADYAVRRVTAICGGMSSLPPSHLSHPFAHAFGWLGAQSRTYVTHGAVIGRNGHGLLLAGCGGQGKSTTALTCAGAGWDFVGDDFFMLECQGDAGWLAHSLYASGRLHPAHAARFPALLANWDSVLSPEDNKLTLFPRAGAVSLARQLTVEAIVLPMVGTPSEVEISPLPRAMALRALIADSVRICPWLTRERAKFYAGVVAQLPCYMLRIGPDLEGIPAAVARVLDRALAARVHRAEAAPYEQHAV